MNFEGDELASGNRQQLLLFLLCGLPCFFVFSPTHTHTQETPLQHAGIITRASSARVQGGRRALYVVFSFTVKEDSRIIALRTLEGLAQSLPLHAHTTPTTPLIPPSPTHPQSPGKDSQGASGRAGEARGRRRSSPPSLLLPQLPQAGLVALSLSGVRRERAASTDEHTHTEPWSVCGSLQRRPASVFRRCVCGRQCKGGGRAGGRGGGLADLIEAG